MVIAEILIPRPATPVLLTDPAVALKSVLRTGEPPPVR